MSAVPKAISDKVDRRDWFACVRCGTSLVTAWAGSRHHRLRREVGGHTIPNIILLCGSGTTGCHGWAHDHPILARAEGLILPANRRPILDPAVMPVKTHRGWFQLTEDGGTEPIKEAEALELLAVFGVHSPGVHG